MARGHFESCGCKMLSLESARLQLQTCIAVATTRDSFARTNFKFAATRLPLIFEVARRGLIPVIAKACL